MNLKHHLNYRSDFSIGQSMLQIGQAISKAKELGYESVSIMDDMNINGMVDFSNKAIKEGIKPIVGVRIRVFDDPLYRKPSKESGEVEKPNLSYFLKAYVLDETGINSIIKLLSRANTPEQFYYTSRAGLDDVLALEGCILSTGDFYSVYHHPSYHAIIERILTEGKCQLYTEIVPINTPLFDTLNTKAMDVFNFYNVQPLVTYPSLYLQNEDADTLEVLAAITSNTQMDSPWRSQQYVKDFGMHQPVDIAKKTVAMCERLLKFEGQNYKSVAKLGLSNIDVVAGICNYKFKKHPPSLPVMASNEFEELVRLVKLGWEERLTVEVLGFKPAKEDLPIYKARLATELKTLRDMGFSGYFLLVHDLIKWSKENAIICGPGRGSSGGSLVAYLMGIVDVDPIRFNLFFERFINPERQDLPDADLDFQSTKRHLVIEYLVGKYGRDRVAGISNYSSLASASALRDSGRVFGYAGIELQATKLVPKENGKSFTLDEAADAVPDLYKFKEDNAALWTHAVKLEGAMRSLGQHAAGIVVAGEPLINRSVVETRTGGPVVNWDKRTVEDWGLIKMDILGLKTLDLLEGAKQYIKERHGVNINYLKLDLADKKVMEAFGKAKTVAVFQFTSSGMRKLLKDLRMGGELTFEDICATTALYRPGPMESGMMNDFVAIKQGVQEVFYEHPNMEAALKNTYGVIVYQEQVMQLARDLAGFSMAQADFLRSAMGKKNLEKMKEMREAWVDGCKTISGMSEKASGNLFDKIESFAGYGFNKSHAAVYSVISFWTMYLKTYYPVEFFAAALTVAANAGEDDDIRALVEDALSTYAIEMMPPDINLSSKRFEIVNDTMLTAPFTTIKGISENVTTFIQEARLKAVGHKFTDKAHFLSLVNKTKVNKRHQESLDKVGAFALIEAGLPPRHPDRLKDQLELLPGLIVAHVKADRKIDSGDKFLKSKIIQIVNETRICKDCNLTGKAHPVVRMGRTARFMVVTDAPNWTEDKANKMLEGDGCAYLKAAISNAGMTANDGYFTSLVKAAKNKDDKYLTNAQITSCSKYLDREIEVLKPPVIVLLGNAAIKHFLPSAKPSEMMGKVVFDAKLDASLVIGFNPMQIAFTESKQKELDKIFTQVFDMVN